jgi:hypothetical protein
MALFGFNRNKEAKRFYLLPGQGGSAYRRKQKFILKWSAVAALLLSAILAALMYWLDKTRF